MFTSTEIISLALVRIRPHTVGLFLLLYSRLLYRQINFPTSTPPPIRFFNHTLPVPGTKSTAPTTLQSAPSYQPLIFFPFVRLYLRSEPFFIFWFRRSLCYFSMLQFFFHQTPVRVPLYPIIIIPSASWHIPIFPFNAPTSDFVSLLIIFVWSLSSR